MYKFCDLSALQDFLRSVYKKHPAEQRRAALVSGLERELEYTTAQAKLYTSIVLCQNAESSVDCVMANGLRVAYSWVRSEQQGNVGSWLSTLRETWQFNEDLNYEHTTERIEQGITTGPLFQSSYSRPNKTVENGTWAPPDTTTDVLKLFVMSIEGIARALKFEWVEKEKYNYQACSIERQRFTRR